jgi:hypothetical protein
MSRKPLASADGTWMGCAVSRIEEHRHTMSGSSVPWTMPLVMSGIVRGLWSDGY